MWNDFKIIRVMGVITIKRILIDAVLCIFQRDESTSLDNLDILFLFYEV